MSLLGLTHLIIAIAALVLGTIVLCKRKGTVAHKQIGYGYAVCIILLNATAFGIYRLFGGFGPFHVMAIVSLVTLLSGMLPVLLKKPSGSWLTIHYRQMSWSVIGLYAAFWAETTVRLFSFPYFWVVTIVATVLTMATGQYLLIRFEKTKLKSIIKSQQSIEVGSHT